MTKLPLHYNVQSLRGEEWGKYQLNVICAAPGCDVTLLERHHLWSRAQAIGDVWWIRLPDGIAVGNCVGLCNYHHRQVTENAAWIVWENGRFDWNDLIAAALPLSWQPPTQGEELLPHEGHLPNECPTCHRSLPKPKMEGDTETKRTRRTWSITVPKDEMEDGAELMDGLLENIREELAKRGMTYGDASAARYFVLSTAMALFLIHVDEVLGDV